MSSSGRRWLLSCGHVVAGTPASYRYCPWCHRDKTVIRATEDGR